MRYQVTHITTYRYHEHVAVSNNLVHLAPRTLPHQQILDHHLDISPSAVALHRHTDWFGNLAGSFAIEQPHKTLVVTARSLVERQAPLPVESFLTPSWERVAGALGRVDPSLRDVVEFVDESPLVPALPQFLKYAVEDFTPGAPVLTVALAVMSRIHKEFRYDSEATSVHTPVAEALALRHGVCQDFSLVLIGVLRSRGLAARYVSGYLETSPPPGRPRLVGADATHAWVQVHTGDATIGEDGWIDLDPTNDCIPGERHITVAYGRDFADVSPLKGMILGGGQAKVDVSVDVERLP
jgi:transglutaminase-like putative cysteine protease